MLKNSVQIKEVIVGRRKSIWVSSEQCEHYNDGGPYHCSCIWLLRHGQGTQYTTLSRKGEAASLPPDDPN